MTSTGLTRRAWLMVFVGFFLCLPVARGGAQPLTQADIKKVMSVRDTADALRDAALTRTTKAGTGKEAPFNQVMVQVQRIGQEADERACRQHGMRVDVYRQVLRRLVNVNDLVELEAVTTEMQTELQRRQSLSEADLRAEANRQNAATEEWFRGIKSKTASGAKAGAGAKAPAASDDYARSLDETVMKPMREQVASGQFVEVVRQANQKRIEEIRGQLGKIEAQLATPAMRQPAADKPVVLAVLDRTTLRDVRTSLIEESPALPAKQ